eukprot:1874488-Pyramimonas_sp.AAC.1
MAHSAAAVLQHEGRHPAHCARARDGPVPPRGRSQEGDARCEGPVPLPVDVVGDGQRPAVVGRAAGGPG